MEEEVHSTFKFDVARFMSKNPSAVESGYWQEAFWLVKVFDKARLIGSLHLNGNEAPEAVAKTLSKLGRTLVEVYPGTTMEDPEEIRKKVDRAWQRSEDDAIVAYLDRLKKAGISI